MITRTQGLLDRAVRNGACATFCGEWRIIAEACEVAERTAWLRHGDGDAVELYESISSWRGLQVPSYSPRMLAGLQDLAAGCCR